MEPCFPGNGWTPACLWEVVDAFLILLCLSTQLLLYRLCIHIVSITYFLIADFLLIPGTQPAPYISGDSFPVWLTSSCSWYLSWYLSLKLCSSPQKVLFGSVVSMATVCTEWVLSASVLRFPAWKARCFIHCKIWKGSLLVQSIEYQKLWSQL